MIDSSRRFLGFTFSLRTMLVFLVLAAIALGLLKRKFDREEMHFREALSGLSQIVKKENAVFEQGGLPNSRALVLAVQTFKRRVDGQAKLSELRKHHPRLQRVLMDALRLLIESVAPRSVEGNRGANIAGLTQIERNDLRRGTNRSLRPLWFGHSSPNHQFWKLNSAVELMDEVAMPVAQTFDSLNLQAQLSSALERLVLAYEPTEVSDQAPEEFAFQGLWALIDMDMDFRDFQIAHEVDLPELEKQFDQEIDSYFQRRILNRDVQRYLSNTNLEVWGKTGLWNEHVKGRVTIRQSP